MRKRIHINQHILRKNRKSIVKQAPITVKTYKTNEYGSCVVIHAKDGTEAARVVYRPANPMSCGAEVWVETDNEVTVIKEEEWHEKDCGVAGGFPHSSSMCETTTG